MPWAGIRTYRIEPEFPDALTDDERAGSGCPARSHARAGYQGRSKGGWGLLRRQAEQVRGVQHVHGGPAAGPVADVTGHVRVAGDPDQAGDEAVAIAVAVHRPR
jgi:hypothetical protein